MATPNRRTRTNLAAARSLIESVFEAGYTFEFPQVVRILEAFRTEATTLGEGSFPSQEAFAISSRITFSVSSAEVHNVKPRWGKKPQLQINFLSLAGVVGPLPTPFVELTQERLRARDTAMRDFLDIFNHRLAALWYRGYKKDHPAATQENPLQSPTGKILLDLAGLFSPQLCALLPLPLRSVLFYTALLWKRPRSLVGLERLLSSYFGVTVDIKPFVGGWQQVDADEHTAIGGRQGRYNVLGVTTILGNKQWQQSAGFLVVLQGLSWESFLSFLPGGNAYETLQTWVQLYAGPLFKPRYRMLLAKNQARSLPLGQGTRLGYTTFLNAPGDSVAFSGIRRVEFQ